LQQTPSTQYGGLHCSLALQLFPGGAGGPHEPVLQNCPAGHIDEVQQ
jgi:hypothetical protein